MDLMGVIRGAIGKGVQWGSKLTPRITPIKALDMLNTIFGAWFVLVLAVLVRASPGS